MYNVYGPKYRVHGACLRKYEEQERGEHRTLSLFCAIQCWRNKWDAICISRDQLKELLNLKRLETKRVKLIMQDFQKLLPHQRDCHYSFKFSRRAFDEQIEIGDCKIPERPISENKFELLEEVLLPTFNKAIFDILTSDNEK